MRPFPDAPAFAKLRSLRSLTLSFPVVDPDVLAGLAGTLVSLTGLEELSVDFCQLANLPAALGQLKSLIALAISGMEICCIEAGCLDLPNLVCLNFFGCNFADAEVLPGLTALQSLKRIAFLGCQGPRFFQPQLEQLPGLQCMMIATSKPCHGGGRVKLARLPADMGSLTLSLRHLDFCGHGLDRFPLALTQLAAFKCLKASRNEFAELPAGITALSRLTELSLGRVMSDEDPEQLHSKRPLDVRALGDLCGFPALCALSFDACEVLLCGSLLGAMRHTSLTSLTFCNAHPAPESALTVLQLGQALRRLRHGSMLRLRDTFRLTCRVVQGRARADPLSPFQNFKAALEACGCVGARH